MDATLLRPHQQAAVALLQKGKDGHLVARRGHSPRGWTLPGGYDDTRLTGSHRELCEESSTFHSRLVTRPTRQEERLAIVVRAIAARHPDADLRVVKRTDAGGELQLAVIAGKGADDGTFAVRPLGDTEELIVTALRHLDAWMLSLRSALVVAPQFPRHASVRPQHDEGRLVIVDESHSMRGSRGSAMPQTLRSLASRFRPS